MSSVILDSSHSLQFVQAADDDVDIEMSDGIEEVRDQGKIGLVEIQVQNSHSLFTQAESDEYTRRVGVITSFLSLMEIAPAKAMHLIHEASQDSTSQQFRDYLLFKQIYADIVRIRESRQLDRKRPTSSSNQQQSVLGPNGLLDSLSWMFAFFNMYSVPFHHKNMDDGDNTILYVREKSNLENIGNITAVLLVQQPTHTPTSDSILSILNEFGTNQSVKSRLGMIVNGSILSTFAIDTMQEGVGEKATRTVSIAQKCFDMSDVKEFAQLITMLEGFLATCMNVETVVQQISRKAQKEEIENQQYDDDMESSPIPRTYTPFPERDHFYRCSRFNTSLSYLIPHSNSYGSLPSDNAQYCVKKRSHFCNWERDVLNKLKNHPYISRELEMVDNVLDANTTMLFEPVRPLNKRLFSIMPTDSQGSPMLVTQQLLNTRFEILRQFIKQALHSIVYCHNNGIAHNNILSRGGTFFLDEQYRLKLMGFDHAIINSDHQLRFRDMRHLAVVFAELMFNIQFDVTCDDDLTDWSAIWEEIQQCMNHYQDIVRNCPHITSNDKLLFKINMKTKKHMFDLLRSMFHTNSTDYYHTYMYHSFVGMASSVYKEKSKQKLREKTIHMLSGNKVINPRRKEDREALIERWTSKRAPSSNIDQLKGSSSSSALVTVQECNL